ncbi:MAG TPA: hypothetical protein VM184_02460 [Gaiellaceae bacterium]|nr:hypothetical protein [Gaiellaceae bacterium]
MSSTSSNRRVAFGAGIAVVVAVTLAFAAGAVGSSTSDSAEIAKLKRQVAVLKTEVKSHAAMRAQLAVLNVSTRIAYIDAAGFHGLETKFASGGFTARDVSTLQNTLAVASKIAWPNVLANDARELQAGLRAFIKAWNAGDMEAASAALKAAHEAQHALSVGAYKWLS